MASQLKPHGIAYITRHDTLHAAALSASRWVDITRPCVVMGDDGRFWVVDRKDAAKLRKVGYECVPAINWAI